MKRLFSRNSKVVKRRVGSIWFLLIGMTLLLSPIICGAQSSDKETTTSEWLKTEIYLGRNLPGGHEVSEWEFSEFIDKVATKHFPKGLTIHNAYGQMQHQNGKIEKQATWVIIIVHDKNPKNTAAIQDVINAYRKRFGKLQVMYFSLPISPIFYAE